MTCGPRPCRRGRVCGLRGGERRCLPEGRGSCALAGPEHVLAFDGRVLTLPPPAPFPSGPCLHLLARSGSQGPCGFSLDAARDGAGLLSLHLNISGHHLQLHRSLVGVITVGESLVLPGCQERCMCLRGQGLQCQPFSCPQGTGCILDGGVRSCETGEGATCHLEPGGHFTTFDGFSGLTPMPVTSCAYELATVVGSRTEDPDWFHVIADFLPCPGCTTRKPRVIIGFRDGCAAVGANQEIWVNGQPARLPVRVCRGVVARWAEGSQVIIERSPTLRVLVGPEGAVALRASPALQGRLRAACGDYNGIAADDLILPGGLRGASLTDVFQACRARGFNNCTEKLVTPTLTQHFA